MWDSEGNGDRSPPNLVGPVIPSHECADARAALVHETSLAYSLPELTTTDSGLFDVCGDGVDVKGTSVRWKSQQEVQITCDPVGGIECAEAFEQRSRMQHPGMTNVESPRDVRKLPGTTENAESLPIRASPHSH